MKHFLYAPSSNVKTIFSHCTYLLQAPSVHQSCPKDLLQDAMTLTRLCYTLLCSKNHSIAACIRHGCKMVGPSPNSFEQVVLCCLLFLSLASHTCKIMLQQIMNWLNSVINHYNAFPFPPAH